MRIPDGLIVATVPAVSGALSPERAERGIAAFKDPFEVELATAVMAFDVPRVKALLPRATYQNLNDLRGNTTLFVYALERGAGGGGWRGRRCGRWCRSIFENFGGLVALEIGEIRE